MNIKKMVLLIISVLLITACEPEKPGFVDGDYSGTIEIDGAITALFVTIRLGNVEKNTNFESPEGIKISKTDIWEIEGALTGLDFTNVVITGSYVNQWQIPVFIETKENNNQILKLNGSFDAYSIEKISGTCSLSTLENGEVSNKVTGSFQIEK